MPAKVTVKINRDELRVLLGSPQGDVYQDLWRRANRVLNRARQLVPVDQGTLRASLHVEPRRTGSLPTMAIGSNLPYALWVHEGTGVYAGGGRITARSGGLLRWPAKNNSGSGRRRYKGGATAGYVFARSIRGMKGTPYLKDALPAAAG